MSKTNEDRAALTVAVARYRSGMTQLLASQVKEVKEIEKKLGVVVGDDSSERVALEDPFGGIFQLHCALLLHKANIHMVAVLGANESNNLHSLAVQMRPILECAGQVKLVIHNAFIEPDRVDEVVQYWERDYLGTLVRAMKGKVSHQEILADLAEIHKAFHEEPLSRTRSLSIEERVRPLVLGKNWSDLLSESFTHGRVDWKAGSWRGGVSSNNTIQDSYAFASFMDYLVLQVGVMNAYAALRIPSEKALGARMNIITSHMLKVQSVVKKLRDSAMSEAEILDDRRFR